MRNSRALLSLLLLLPLGGCSAAVSETTAPRCDQISDELVIMAQSVPSASRVPCIESLPVGWNFGRIEVRSGGTEFSLDSDRAGASAFEVSLSPTCDLEGATEVPSEEVGARHFERVRLGPDTYSGERIYEFEGGCVTYSFDFSGEGRTALATEITSGLAFKSRDEISEGLDAYGVKLDP